MDFYKYHALGNDYIVIDPNKIDVSLSPDNIRLICHRNFGIGSDGILYGPIFGSEKMKLRILNPDGSEAQKSGNGIRIFSKYLLDAGYITSRIFQLITLGGEVTIEITDSSIPLITVNMGAVTFQSDLIPVAGPSREVIENDLLIDSVPLKMTCLSIGNPHCIISMPNISKEIASALGPRIETLQMFPNRINVQFLKVLDRQNIQIEIWERGAGYTLASGSSSCAAASAAYRLGLTNETMKVHMPGGKIDISIQPNGDVYMTGSVSNVMQGRFAPEFRQLLK
ncbi:MAG: diaminopimelate epimerase [Scytonema hyalinum WJT4-NPBG1]|jgi:diaminopimelate epimerase|nr:diaminopimelate epimerase [Scytonema hyalinum WJT4-NPBG1]